MTTKERYSF